MDYFGYGDQDFIPCEVCGVRAVDVHHIFGRGKGKDNIDNLMALCRRCHRQVHEGNASKETYYKIHQRKINNE